MLTDVLIKIFERDLAKLKTEIEQYADEADLWKKQGDIPNSGGNLCLHLCGNLRHFIGGVLGDSGYVRNRDLEFSDPGVPREKLLSLIDSTADEVKNALSHLSAADLEKEYSLDVFGYAMTTEFFVVHLATHLSYHLGQIDYHRRTVAA